MAIACVARFLETLNQAQLLDEGQRRDLSDLAARFPDARDLAREMMRCGWLTAYQVNQLFLGNKADLFRGPYMLLERLGEGGMGQVFKARHRKLGRVVALKVIRKEYVDNSRALLRFQREIQIAAQLNHPNIVRALDADQVDGILFFAMEFIEGTDLARLIKERGPLPVLQACDYARQAALGLQHAFERGLIHRDVKPANLLVSGGCQSSGSPTSGHLPQPFSSAYRWGVVKILDMGLARLLDQEESPTSMLTQFGSVVGTPDFIAPEQARNSHTSDIRADLYSLGCTLYYLLTGQVPFTTGNVTEKLLHHQLDEPEPLVQARRERLLKGTPGRTDLVRGRASLDVPEEVVQLVRRLMAKRPENRYQTPAELAARLTDLAVRLEAKRPARPKLTPTEKTLPDGVVVVRPSPATGQMPAAPVPLKRAPRTQRLPRPDLDHRRWLGVRTRGNLIFFGLLLLASLCGRALNSPQGMNAAPPAAASRSEMAWAQLLHDTGQVQGNVAALRGRLVAFRADFPGTLEAQAAAKWLARLPSPLDRLEPLTIPARKRASWFPADLVDVLGEPVPFSMEPAQCVAFSLDGTQVVRGGTDTLVRRWQMDLQRELPALRGHEARIDRLAYTPNGRTLASASWDGRVTLWDAQTGRMRKSWAAHKYPVAGLVFTPDGRTLVTGSWDGTVKLWDSATGRIVRTLPGDRDNRVLSIAISPDGRLLASGHEDQKVRLWVLTNRAVEPRAVYRGNTSWVKVVAFAPDSRTLVSGGGGDGTLRVCTWDGSKFREGPVLSGHRHVVHGVAFAFDGKMLASASEDHSVKVWEVATGKRVREWADLRGAVNGVAFAPDGRHLATANANSMVYVLRLAEAPRDR